VSVSAIVFAQLLSGCAFWVIIGINLQSGSKINLPCLLLGQVKAVKCRLKASHSNKVAPIIIQLKFKENRY
jgi:hypothetical protein